MLKRRIAHKRLENYAYTDPAVYQRPMHHKELDDKKRTFKPMSLHEAKDRLIIDLLEAGKLRP